MPSIQPDHTSEPPYSCEACPRLANFLKDFRNQHPNWHNGPIPSWGNFDSELLIVGLAPGMQGANRTGRPFTGDFAGDLLYSTLTKFNLASGTYKAHPDDGLKLNNVKITNAVRCLPPKNKPTGHEITTCNTYLTETIKTMPKLTVIIALGRIAHEAIIKSQKLRQKDFRFSHCAIHTMEHLTLIDSYHCSRYNTNTGVLTTGMFHDVFAKATAIISK